ncbi:hypothetical protein Q5P01_019336 [Channa striata]|uniref:USP domain-containing protein n=1 Tax=Channa striata TaxID=64152 RepID=A0AA88M2X6_CHASR|nr:hypothetical protein Q5P01_019336 [Channa striata]
MVVFFEWHWTVVDQMSSGGLPMTGEDSGLGSLASPLAGYLGKVQERAGSLEYCPWCTSKGLNYALRSYHINLQESITLCTNPQCLFPLVSRSFEDVLAGLVPLESTTSCKRKNPVTLEKEEIECSPKRLRSSELDSFGVRSVTDTPIGQAKQCDVNTISNGQNATVNGGSEMVNGVCEEIGCSNAETTGLESLKNEDVPEPDNPACTEDFSPPLCPATGGHLQSSSEAMLNNCTHEPVVAPHCSQLEVEDDSGQVKSHPGVLTSSLDSNQSPYAKQDVYPAKINTQLFKQTAWTEQKSQTDDIATCKDTGSTESKTEDLSCTLLPESEKLVSVPKQLFWSNRDNLCWLDSLLISLVNCKTLRNFKPKDEPQRASVWQLMKKYEDISAEIQAHQQTGSDDTLRVHNHVLQKANADLQNLRMSIFSLLQPKLHCKLGQRETPVFAIPLLLSMDSWVEPLFQSTFQWAFKCSECKTSSKERVMKTLPTFTNIVPDWDPLHAVHLAPCNTCCKKNQRRTMILESVPPVFVLHFVEGLPDNDVKNYTFNFQGKRYSVTTVIQYNHQLKHFVTWIFDSDGSWFEYDDLKHPHCKTHQKLPVPPREMHVVFWEVEEDKELRTCSPSSTFEDCPPSKNAKDHILNEKHVTGDEPSASTPDQSPLIPHNDTDIVCAFSPSEDNSSIMDTSIGSTTLLDTFKGLSHNDIITLTLMEINPDSDTKPLNDSEQTPDLNVSNKNETPDSAPDSSSSVSETCRGSDAEVATTSSSSDPESRDSSSSDPTYVPFARRGRGKGTTKSKTVSRQKGKKTASAKADPHISPPAPSKSSTVTSSKATVVKAQDITPSVVEGQDNTPSVVETAQQKSPASSTANQDILTKPTTIDRWSFLLSKHPVNQGHKAITKVTPTHTPTTVTPVKPVLPTHSTPNPVRRQQVPGGHFPKPLLKTEDSEGLPLKAAEMYGAFRPKSVNAQSLPPPPAPLRGTSDEVQPVPSQPEKSPTKTAVAVSGTSLPTPVEKGLPVTFSSKKNGSLSLKAPPSHSKTEILRYKLMKKLKAKKKKLDKLNKQLGCQGSSLCPDSTDLSSPNTVTSSTYTGSTYDDFLSDLLSPATTASNLSPDSTSLLEILASKQEGVEQLDCGVNAAGVAPQTDTCVSGPNNDNFLDEFFSQAGTHRLVEMETEALSALEMFM